MERLLKLLEESELTPSQLEELKIQTRIPENTQLLTTKNLNQLSDQFILKLDVSKQIQINALTIIANSLLLSKTLRNVWTSDRLYAWVIHMYKSDVQNRYLLGRMLFLLTFSSLPIKQENITDTITLLENYLDEVFEDIEDQMPRLAGIEFLKVMFNILHNYKREISQELGKKLVVILMKQPDMDVQRYICNIFTIVSVNIWFEPSLPQFLLDKASILIPKTDFCDDTVLSPFLTCLLGSVKYVCGSDDKNYIELKAKLKKMVSPTAEDRAVGVGKSKSLASMFVHLASKFELRNSNRIIQEVYWELFDHDQVELTSIMGFGYASSFANGDFEGAKPRVEEIEESNTSHSSPATNSKVDSTRKVDPVTGQWEDIQEAERLRLKEEWDKLTDAEKEEESEKMFVLFEKLKVNGIFKIQNNPFDPRSKSN